MITQTTAYKGLTAVTLENECLKLTVLPELGAKMASLVYKPQNFEVFFQPTDGVFRLSKFGANFADYDTAGADDMFPTIDACRCPGEGCRDGLLPDHGDLWSIPWTVTATQDQVWSQVAGRSLPYEFSRSIRLEKSRVHLEYQVTNTGDKPLWGLWAFHGLTACDESTRLILPQVDRVINVHPSASLGCVGSEHPFPITADITGQSYHLDRIKPKGANNTEKFYVNGRVQSGQAALTLNNNRLLYQLEFPTTKVPYLGVWINQGGFKGEYNCALEPATGFYDSAELAYARQSLLPIMPQGVLRWYLIINLEAI